MQNNSKVATILELSVSPYTHHIRFNVVVFIERNIRLHVITAIKSQNDILECDANSRCHLAKSSSFFFFNLAGF